MSRTFKCPCACHRIFGVTRALQEYLSPTWSTMAGYQTGRIELQIPEKPCVRGKTGGSGYWSFRTVLRRLIELTL